MGDEVMTMREGAGIATGSGGFEAVAFVAAAAATAAAVNANDAETGKAVRSGMGRLNGICGSCCAGC